MLAENLDKKQSQETTGWFDNMVANLRYDQTLLENDILEDNKKKVYGALISGDDNFLHEYARQGSSAYFITKMVESYFRELIRSNHKPKQIALELSNSKIMVWAEIEEDDEAMENALILAEAKINAQFLKYGFHLSSTIVDNTDNLLIPEHYKSVSIT